MQVILKQRDIEQALKQYIAGQGINIKGKTVNIAFTAGRKETGISAELDIDDIPGYMPAAEFLTVDAPEVQEAAVAEEASETVTQEVESPFGDAGDAAEVAEEVVAESTAPTPTSLFG